MTLPLDGVRVVDFTRVLAGPHCTKHLLDLGAEVIKIEPPAGDISRVAYPRQGEISGYYAQQNAGKRNLSIDLNVPAARDAVGQLCDTADVIVENFRPGALAAFGLGYQSVAARNPAVVYVSISGYGQSGPWRTRSAYAPTVQAEVGFTANTLRQFDVEGNERRSDSLSHGDVYAGLHGAIAVLAALQRRTVTGQGQYVDVAMAAVLTSINERIHYDLSGLDIGAEPPILGATDCPFFTSPEGVEFVAPVSLVGTMTFPFYLRAMRRPDLADDERFRTVELRRRNAAALHAIVQDWIYGFDSMDSLDAQFDEAKVATGRLRDAVEFNETEWAKGWVTTREVSDRHGGVITIPAPPWHFSDHDGLLDDQLPARQGEHNEEILKELGCTDGQIQALKDSGALIGPVG
ncbi:MULTISPECIES: CaiB/BaiF CoA-transferase family protein [unclassified Mycobacterium]|uniref:CaiB/BaiF CoA transferase family protein n=1 Tax=unclassified Mycobacterium TaxID=2642494 RepID=UPI00080030DF|nr:MULTISPECIES: CaiB/BaiF CoA-transferase family protein [unclassified Mycobacterium]OBG71606.1 formyl-CoA transferase [Mycobacterium sp. E1214]OBH31993.1 formyl-CoA transferase [Mycobacterium sp. E1319]